MGIKTRAKVAPLPHTLPGIDWIEIRRGIWIRVRHLKPFQSFDNAGRVVHEGNSFQDANQRRESHQWRISNLSLKRGDAQTGLNDASFRSSFPRESRSSRSSRLHIRDRSRSDEMHNPEEFLLLFFHGVGGSSDIWLGQLNHFASLGYEVVAPDMIGHGLSSTPNDPVSYEFINIAADAILLFDKYRKGCNVVVGHSYGTSFATFVAHHRRSDVNKLILVSAGAPLALAPETGFLAMPACVLHCLRPVIRHTFRKKAFYKLTKQLRPNTEVAFDVPMYVLRYIMMGQVWFEGGVALHQSIRTPTLIVYGENDALGSLEDAIDMHETMPCSHLQVIANCSHMVMMEQTEVLNSGILTFVNSSLHQGYHKEEASSLHSPAAGGQRAHQSASFDE